MKYLNKILIKINFLTHLLINKIQMFNSCVFVDVDLNYLINKIQLFNSCVFVDVALNCLIKKIQIKASFMKKAD